MLTLPPYLNKRSVPTLTSRDWSSVLSEFLVKQKLYVQLPDVDIANTWNGVSEIVRVYHVTANAPFVMELEDTTANYCACVSWIVGSTVYRYKIVFDKGEVLYVPEYNRERIPVNYTIEIWNVDEANLTGSIGIFRTPNTSYTTDFCAEPFIVEDDFTDCVDITFVLDGWNPSTHHFELDGSCGSTVLAVNEITLYDELLLEADDGTWHVVTLTTINGITSLTVNQANSAETGLPFYLKLLTDPYEISLTLQGGLYGITVDAAPGESGETVIGLLSDDGNHYAISLFSDTTLEVGQVPL
jgi:hypothetical protein